MILKELLEYDIDTGFVRWKTVGKGRRIPKGVWFNGIAGSRGYRSIFIEGKLYRYHHVCWALCYNQWPINEIDHIDGNRSNNAITNLRDVTSSVNNHNKRMYRKNSTGVPGVRWDKDKYVYRAQININNKIVMLGTFTTLENAIAARREAEKTITYGPNHGK